jgi:hypothetical protein
MTLCSDSGLDGCFFNNAPGFVRPLKLRELSRAHPASRHFIIHILKGVRDIITHSPLAGVFLSMLSQPKFRTVRNQAYLCDVS